MARTRVKPALLERLPGLVTWEDPGEVPTLQDLTSRGPTVWVQSDQAPDVWYIAVHGIPPVSLPLPHFVDREPTWRDLVRYLENAPGGWWGGGVLGYQCAWRRASLKPAARKPWSEVTPRTKQGYAGRMKSYGLTTDAQQKAYYESVPSLLDLRRKKTETYYVPATEGFSGGPWLSVWQS